MTTSLSFLFSLFSIVLFSIIFFSFLCVLSEELTVVSAELIIVSSSLTDFRLQSIRIFFLLDTHTDGFPVFL